MPRQGSYQHRSGTANQPDAATLLLRSKIASADSGSVLLRAARNEVIYGYGSKNAESSVYLVENGYVKLVTPTRAGKDCLLGIFSAGDLVGELAFSGVDRNESLTALTPAILWRIPKSRVLALLENAGIREEFVRYLAQRLFEQQRLITHLVTDDSEHRLAAVLLYLARKIGLREGARLVINARITQEELAAMVGTTRSRVGLFLKRFIEIDAVNRMPGGGLLIHEGRLEEFAATAELRGRYSRNRYSAGPESTMTPALRCISRVPRINGARGGASAGPRCCGPRARCRRRRSGTPGWLR